MTPHPAKYSEGLVPLFQQILYRNDAYGTVLDPFAGTGRIHELMNPTVGVELEKEWASMHRSTLHGDCIVVMDELIGKGVTFSAIVTSPAYGNRMADHHEAKDNSKRMTYRHQLGRPLTDNNSGGMQWGKTYRDFHRDVWERCAELLEPEVGILVLNCSDHIRAGQEVPVTGFHAGTVLDLGFDLIEAFAVPTPRMGFGKNAKLRTPYEYVLTFRKQPEEK